MTTPTGRDRPAAGAVGGGADKPRRGPLDLNRLALESPGSPGFGLVERFEGRTALAGRIASALAASLPGHLTDAGAVLWLTCEMGLRGFTASEIRAALPSAGLRITRDRRNRRGRAPEAVRRQEPSPSAENNPNPEFKR